MGSADGVADTGENGAPLSYVRRIYRVPAALADDLAVCLVASGARGCETKGAADEKTAGEVRLEAWFDAGVEALDATTWPGVELETSEQVAERDWLADYRASSRPFTVGRFRIDPRESSASGEGEPGMGEPGMGGPGGEPVDLHVPAENAFGTGSHESTRLMLLWLDELARRDQLTGCRVLDVGSGSGILCFAALRLGAGLAVGYDFDLASVVTSCRNARRNHVAPLFFAGTAAALAQRPSVEGRFDLVLVNVLPERILDDVPRLVSGLAAGGHLLSSGNLTSRRDELLGRFEACGLSLRGEKIDGEWISFLLARSG